MSEEMKDPKDVIKQIVDSAAKKGTISYKEIIDYLEKYQLEANQIEKIYDGLEAANVEIVEDSEEPDFEDLEEIEDDIKLEDVCVILSSLLLQIALYSSKLTDTKNSFLQEIRANEISEALADFYKSDSVEKCMAVLNAVKTDLLVLEYLNGRRELN